MLAKEELEHLMARLLKEAQTRGATSAEADVSVVSGLSTTVRLGDVETVEHNQDRGLGITVYLGQRKGSASTSDFRDSAISEVVSAAIGIAKYTAEDGYAGLADENLMAYDYPDLDLCYPWELEAEAAIDLAQACEVAAKETDGRITNSEGASVSTHHGVHVYGNSHGFIGAYPTSRHSISCSVIAQEGDNMQRDHWYSTARNPAELEDVTVIGKCAGERAVRRLGMRRLATCQAPVVFAAEVASSLFGHFISAIRGESLYRKSTFLLDSLGKKVFSNLVNISERPHLIQSLGSAPFDSEGVATRSRELVAEGVVQGYVLDSYAARKLGMQTTANAGGVHNLIVAPGEKELNELLCTMNKGLLVTELMGQGANKVTGDYSRGAAGFWVENGEIQYPVEEITIAGNLANMYQGIQEIGSDVDLRRNIRTGSVLIDQMAIAGS